MRIWDSIEGIERAREGYKHSSETGPAFKGGSSSIPRIYARPDWVIVRKLDVHDHREAS